VRLLLDTHAFLWWIGGDHRLPQGARAAISSPGSEVFFSAASGWELAIKTRLGRLRVEGTLDAFLSTELQANAFGVLPITLPHAVRVASLPALHSDPFDRMLVAQALVEGLHLVTGDRQIARYDVGRVW
jgi:PIN domain nuclease of toxin-antitoxin system